MEKRTQSEPNSPAQSKPERRASAGAPGAGLGAAMPKGSEHLRESAEKPAAPAAESRESKPAEPKAGGCLSVRPQFLLVGIGRTEPAGPPLHRWVSFSTRLSYPGVTHFHMLFLDGVYVEPRRFAPILLGEGADEQRPLTGVKPPAGGRTPKDSSWLGPTLAVAGLTVSFRCI